jgi:hypothetical protein
MATRLKDGQEIIGKNGVIYTLRLVKYIKPARGDKADPDYKTLGQIDRAKCIIRLRSDLSQQHQLMYLIHEYLHDAVGDFEEYDLTKELFVDFLSGDLYQFLKLNKLVMY